MYRLHLYASTVRQSFIFCGIDYGMASSAHVIYTMKTLRRTVIQIQGLRQTVSTLPRLSYRESLYVYALTVFLRQLSAFFKYISWIILIYFDHMCACYKMYFIINIIWLCVSSLNTAEKIYQSIDIKVYNYVYVGHAHVVLGSSLVRASDGLPEAWVHVPIGRSNSSYTFLL